ncbi:glycosyltransferase [Robiginitalea biformata HTCC2501]|uniref:Glycosyltransferase n=2 Tax=Flavobacteriaceae TaxID=49546 RepID=A4CKC6_ROBBH|nr:glycosyltransferase [Robiginitalea biformata HTCC2501]
MGYELNLQHPRTLNEKINWLKLHDRTPLHSQCSDKYAVRDYVKGKIGENYLVPLYFSTEDAADINERNIDKFPCIIKTNHDSSGGVFLREKEGVDWQEIQAKMAKRMHRNYYTNSREWQYKNIKPRIIVEQLLLDDEGKIPADIKVHVFHGKPEMIQMDEGRGTDGHFRNWYSPSWDLLPMRWSSVLKNGRLTDPKNVPVDKPRSLDKILELSRQLAEPFLYARIDWYEVGNRIYFGEITFHHDGGYRPILPKEWDYKLGEKLDLQHQK